MLNVEDATKLQSFSATPNQSLHATIVKISLLNHQEENANQQKEAHSKLKHDMFLLFKYFITYFLTFYFLLQKTQIFLLINIQNYHSFFIIICDMIKIIKSLYQNVKYFKYTYQPFNFNYFKTFLKGTNLNKETLYFNSFNKKMQPQQNIDNLFDIKVTQCHHILNVQYHIDPKIQKIPLHKGNLFLGGVGTFKEPIINGFRITAVLSILDQPMFKRFMIKQKVQHLKILKHKWIDLEDEEDQKIGVHFDDTYTFIKQSLKEHNVLVHCQMGISRSATILIAYLMKEFNLKYQPAFELVNKKRKYISPNQGFKQELLEYQKRLFN